MLPRIQPALTPDGLQELYICGQSVLARKALSGQIHRHTPAVSLTDLWALSKEGAF